MKTMKDLTDPVDGKCSFNSLQVTMTFFEVVDTAALEGIAELSCPIRRVRVQYPVESNSSSSDGVTCVAALERITRSDGLVEWELKKLRSRVICMSGFRMA